MLAQKTIIINTITDKKYIKYNTIIIITGRLMGQYCFARSRLSASSVVVCNARGRHPCYYYYYYERFYWLIDWLIDWQAYLGTSDHGFVERCMQWSGWATATRWYTWVWWTIRQTRVSVSTPRLHSHQHSTKLEVAPTILADRDIGGGVLNTGEFCAWLLLIYSFQFSSAFQPRSTICCCPHVTVNFDQWPWPSYST